MRSAAALVTAALLSCSGHPRYVKGDRGAWVLPLVEPNAGSELLVEAHIGDRGPYLFRVNPDAPYTSIDDSLGQELGLYTRNEWAVRITQDDRPVRSRSYEIAGLRLGELELERFGAASFKPGSFDVRGRRISGVLGGGVLSTTLIVEIDRDRGYLRLARTGHEAIPASATAIRGVTYRSHLYVPASIGGTQVELRVDLGRSTSVWPHTAKRLGLSRVLVDDHYVDATGTAKRRDQGVAVGRLVVGALELAQETAVVYWESGWLETDVRGDGFLGRDTLARYHVVIDRDNSTLWLAPRTSARPQP